MDSDNNIYVLTYGFEGFPSFLAASDFDDRIGAVQQAVLVMEEQGVAITPTLECHCGGCFDIESDEFGRGRLRVMSLEQFHAELCSTSTAVAMVADVQNRRN